MKEREAHRQVHKPGCLTPASSCEGSTCCPATDEELWKTRPRATHPHPEASLESLLKAFGSRGSCSKEATTFASGTWGKQDPSRSHPPWFQTSLSDTNSLRQSGFSVTGSLVMKNCGVGSPASKAKSARKDAVDKSLTRLEELKCSNLNAILVI